MTAGPKPTEAPIARVAPEFAAEWARTIAMSVIAGRVSIEFAEEAVETLRADAYWDLANSVKSAVAHRRGLLVSRGFASFGGAR